jgi:hypothetical protein
VSPLLIETSGDVEVIPMNKFEGLDHLARADVSSNSQVKEIHRFGDCTSLCELNSFITRYHRVARFHRMHITD